MAWVARGKCKALGTKKSSTPAVVPGAAPALARVGGFLVKSSKIHDFLGILGGSSHFLSDLYYPNLSYTFGEFA